MRCAPLFGLWLLACSESSSLPPELDRSRAALAVILADVDAVLMRTASTIAGVGFEAAEARAAAAQLCAGRAYAVDCFTLDAQGIVRIAEPEAYRDHEGVDISDQPQVQELLANRHPVMSDMFLAIEGFQAVDIEYPILSGSALIGAQSILVRPEQLCGSAIAPLLEGTSYKAWVMQLDGLITYESDPTQVGLNLFSDPLYQDYPELLELGRRIAAAPDGQGGYTFLIHGTQQVVHKEAAWSTVSLYGREWRLVIYWVV